MGKDELGFTIYCAGILAERLGITEREAYHLLCKGDIVDGYIVPCFDVLHTFSKEYIGILLYQSNIIMFISPLF